MRIASLTAAFLLWTFTVPPLAAGDLWVTDFEKAKATAAKEGKDLLLNFTGSDWCSWCIKLRKEVLDSEAFKSAAPGKFVLMEVDFPQKKIKLSRATQDQNAALQKEFAIEGFPSIVLADAKGRAYGQTGYEEGGPEEYLKHLDEMREVRVKRDEAWSKAERAEGLEKAKLLAEGLNLLDEEMAFQHYTRVIAEIAKLDPQDTTGVGAVMSFKSDLAKMKSEIARIAEKEGTGEIRIVVDGFIISHPKITSDKKQIVLMQLLKFYRPPKDIQTVLNLMGEVKALNPESEIGMQATGIEANVKQMIENTAAKPKKK